MALHAFVAAAVAVVNAAAVVAGNHAGHALALAEAVLITHGPFSFVFLHIYLSIYARSS